MRAMDRRYDLIGAGMRAPRERAGCFDPRLPFLTTVTLAPVYAVVDVAQRYAIGPDTAFSAFYKLPAGAHVLAFVGIYVAVWLAWYIVLRIVTGGRRRAPSVLERMTEVHAARALLNVYLAVVLGVVAILTLLRALDLGVGVQALLLVFTCVYAELAYHGQARV